jgi:hypothetical protein
MPNPPHIMGLIASDEEQGLANKDVPETSATEQKEEIRKIQDRLDLLDQRLDNIDSIASALVERVMKQPVTLNMTCSRCGSKIEIALLGMEKPSQ